MNRRNLLGTLLALPLLKVFKPRKTIPDSRDCEAEPLGHIRVTMDEGLGKRYFVEMNMGGMKGYVPIYVIVD